MFIPYELLVSSGGIVVVFLIAWLASYHRTKISWSLVGRGFLLQMLLACAMLKTTGGTWLLGKIAAGVTALYGAADAGIAFLFGKLADPQALWGYVFAFKVLPIIIFFGAFMGCLSAAGIIRYLVSGMRALVQPLFGTSGPETLCLVANSFLGQTEAPLLIRQYLATMTPSELFLMMVAGMGTMSGAIIAVYGAMGVPVMHMLTATVMAIPSTLIIAKIIYPETEPVQAERNEIAGGSSRSLLESIAAGTSDGLVLAANVGAMLIAFIGLIALGNMILQPFGCSLQMLAGYLFAPIGWLLGLTGTEATTAGSLLGTKVTINEMIAYGNLVTAGLSERSVAILTYLLCGFANISSIGIQVGGIGALVPERRVLLARLGWRALLGASLANLLSALIASILL